eukprot:IDg21404t1
MNQNTWNGACLDTGTEKPSLAGSKCRQWILELDRLHPRGLTREAQVGAPDRAMGTTTETNKGEKEGRYTGRRPLYGQQALGTALRAVAQTRTMSRRRSTYGARGRTRIVEGMLVGQSPQAEEDEMR